ncbi:hypothetical protein EDD85DRAFT_935166 [Armillaria nabsnona]|nr:hypothetical protein EDD85DRAFT_935166 [Armillaria nabsnona]
MELGTREDGSRWRRIFKSRRGHTGPDRTCASCAFLFSVYLHLPPDFKTPNTLGFVLIHQSSLSHFKVQKFGTLCFGGVSTPNALFASVFPVTFMVRDGDRRVDALIFPRWIGSMSACTRQIWDCQILGMETLAYLKLQEPVFKISTYLYSKWRCATVA